MNNKQWLIQVLTECETRHLGRPRTKKPKPVLNKKCVQCGECFETTRGNKRLCSTKCQVTRRKETTRLYGLDWLRKKNGTYQKYAMILRAAGWTVIAPEGKG